MDDAELVNKPLEAWTKWALFWLTVFPFVGILVSIRFHNREFLGGMPLFTFGRLCSVHLGGCAVRAIHIGSHCSLLLLFRCAARRRALALWPCERREQGSDPWPVHAQSGGSLGHAGEAGDDLLFSHAERQEYADPGARWHPVWHGTEAMMVHGGLLIRSRSHSSR